MTKVQPLLKQEIKERILKLEKRKENRKNIKLFFHPIKTLKYFLIVIKDTIVSSILFLKTKPFLLFFSSLILSFLLAVVYVPGNHQQYIEQYKESITICLWWIGLGILSSVGLGTGLHTFVLYLGPHIARVTLAATQWNSLDFEQYGPNSFINPNTHSTTSTTSNHIISFWDILSAVQIAALCWGAGTAIGELPPYFVARTARLKGLKLEQQQAEQQQQKDGKPVGLLERLSKSIPNLIGNMGFFGILAFASIPNPLFDLAGITCGHFLVPFWKFFGATLIGKAVIKAHIQACFVILAFNMETLTWVVSTVENYIPWSKGKILPILEKEKQRLDSSSALKNTPKSFVGIVWDCVLAAMICYFIISIIDSSVQEFLIEKDTKKIQDLKDQLENKKNDASGSKKETKKNK